MDAASALPDYSDQGSRLRVMLGVGIAFLILSWTVVALRVYVRTILIKAFQTDDWTMLISLVLFTTYCSCEFALREAQLNPVAIAALSKGLFAKLVIVEKIMPWIISLYALYLATSVMLKISVALSFLRILNNKYQRYAIYVSSVVYAVYGTAFCFIAVFQCGNPANFTIKQAEGQCINANIVQHLNYAGAALNIASDWVFVAIPISVVWRSRMPKVTKVTAAFLLSLGALSSICSIVRLKFIPGLRPGHNFLHSSMDTGTWSCIELGLGIIAVSLSTLRPLFKSVLGGSSNRSGVYGSTAKYNTSNANGTKLATVRTQEHHVDGLYRISDDDFCGITTTVVGPDAKGIEMEEVSISKEAGYSVKETSLEEGRKGGNVVMSHWNESEHNLVSPPQNGVLMVTEVVVRGSNR